MRPPRTCPGSRCRRSTRRSTSSSAFVSRRIGGAGTAVLYDPRTDAHHHFLCRRCARVIDVDAGVDERRLAAAARAAGLQVDGVDVTLRGLCPDCR